MENGPISPNFRSNPVTSQIKNILSFAHRGWPVFPLHYPTSGQSCSCGKENCQNVGKHPMTKNGFKDASIDEEVVSTWWERSPRANVGVLTGQQSGIVVLDIDIRHGGSESLTNLEQEYDMLPPTLRVKTGGGGWHYYFRHPGLHIPNRVNIRPGIDFRGDGGYIIAPPSVHASKQSYVWADPSDEILELPEWLKELILNKKTAVIKSTETKPVSTLLGDGSRNNSLMSIGGFLKSRGMERDLILKTLSALNEGVCTPPLGSDEVYKIASSLEKYEEKPWPQIQELSKPADAPALTADMIPNALQVWCADIAERMQVPLEFTVGPALVMIAGMIGRKIAIHPKQNDDWKVIPKLWGALIAPPGSMKSPAMSAVLKPLTTIAIKARDRYLEEAKTKEKEEIIIKTEIEAIKEALKAAVKQGKQDVLDAKKRDLEVALAKCEELHVRERRYMMNDPTIEKLLTVMVDNPQGLLLYRDELSGWMETMFKSGREGDREFFLECWNGDTPYSMDRVGRGTTFVDGLCLSVMGGVQPSKFSSYVSSVAKGGKSDDGLLQRFQILLYPERRADWKNIDRKPDFEAIKNIENILDKIDQIPMPVRDQNKEIQRIHIRYSHAAQLVADKWTEKLETRLASKKLSTILEAHLSKYRSLMPTLALIFCITESFSSDNGLPKHIDEKSTILATQWCEFLEQHARKAYGEYIEPDLAAGRKLLERIKEGAVKDFDRCRDIYRKGWKGLSTTEEFEGAVKTLAEYGWIRTEAFTPPTGGRTEVIRLNPTIRSNIP